MTNETKARAILRAAIETRTKKQSLLAAARAAEKRADTLVDAAEGRLAEARNARQDASQRAAQKIKAGKANVDMRAEGRAVQEAEADLAGLIETRQALIDDRQRAEKAEADATLAVREAAGEVMRLIARDLANEYLQAVARAEYLDQLLFGLLFTPRPDKGVGQFPAGADVGEALTREAAPRLCRQSECVLETAAWTRFAEALADDADAEFAMTYTLDLSAKIAAE